MTEEAARPTTTSRSNLLTRAFVALEGAPARVLVFGPLVVIGFLNGSSETIYKSVAGAGLVDGLLQTFGVSIILWGACGAAIAVLLSEPSRPATRGDFVVAALVGCAVIVPVPALSWPALCVAAGWLYLTSAPGGAERRAAIIILAMTIPPFWARLLFAALTDTILRIDAVLVGLVVGTGAYDNIVPFVDGSGVMFIAPGCSSFTNVSLAILFSAVVANVHARPWSASTALWAVATCAAVISINVLRMSMIGFYPDQYELLHGPVGATVAGWLTTAAILVIGMQGLGRRDA